MSERLSTMTPHRLMPHSIPHPKGRDRHLPGDVSGQVFKKPSGASHGPKRVDEFIGPVDVIPGEPLLVIAQLRGVIIQEEFVPQPAKKTDDPLVLAAKVRIGLNQEGFFAVSAGSKVLQMRIVDAGGLCQQVSVEMPSYDPGKLVVAYRNGLVIASA